MEVSASDESPYAPKIRVKTSPGITQIWLLKDGQTIASIVPPVTDFTIPSLDQMSGGAVFEVQATDASGLQVLFQNVHLSRPHSTVRNSGEGLLQYLYKPPIAGLDPDYRIAHCWHAVGLAVLYAEWDCVTFGARNGRVFHEQAEQSLFWDNSNVGSGQSPAIYPSIFNGSYSMSPYVGNDRFLLERCLTTGLTAYGFGLVPEDHRISNCTWPAVYTRDGASSGTASIDELNASNMWPTPRADFIGDDKLTVWP